MNSKKVTNWRWRRGVLIGCILTLSVLTGACSKPADQNVVYLAVAGPESRMEGEFKNGIALALEEINTGDYLAGRTVQVDYFDDKRDLTTGIKIAQSLADQKDHYSAVIGHWNASINIPAAQIYEDAGLTAITPMVSSPELTEVKRNYIFRTVPSDREEAILMAEYAASQGYQTIAICYADSTYGRDLADEFQNASQDRGISIADAHLYFINQAEFNLQYEKWTALGVDAVFVADSLPYAKDMITMIREKSKDLPILSASGFSLDDVVALMGTDSNHISYVTLFHPANPSAGFQQFAKAYQTKYGEIPASFLSYIGYETIYLISDAVNATGSTASAEIAAYLHQMGPRQGLIDTYNFTENGDPQGIRLSLVEVKNGSTTYLQK